MGFAVPDSTWSFFRKTSINQDHIITSIDHIILKGCAVFYVIVKMLHAVLSSECKALGMETFLKIFYSLKNHTIYISFQSQTGLNKSLPFWQRGHLQLSGRSLNFVPGSIPCLGSPLSGS